jgi:hypothetical protein
MVLYCQSIKAERDRRATRAIAYMKNTVRRWPNLLLDLVGSFASPHDTVWPCISTEVKRCSEQKEEEDAEQTHCTEQQIVYGR